VHVSVVVSPVSVGRLKRAMTAAVLAHSVSVESSAGAICNSSCVKVASQSASSASQPMSIFMCVFVYVCERERASMCLSEYRLSVAHHIYTHTHTTIYTQTQTHTYPAPEACAMLAAPEYPEEQWTDQSPVIERSMCVCVFICVCVYTWRTTYCKHI
jgi:hypothetical protein